MKTREAVKAILWTPSKEIALVYGRGANGLTLPGGGIEKDETREAALLRELQEELGLDESHLEDLRSMGSIDGQVTSASGERFMAAWYVSQAVVSKNALASVVTRRNLSVIRNEQIARHPSVAYLAKRAIHQFATLPR